MSDARSLLFLLVVALLLLPELAEIEIAGLVRLKRQVEAAKTEAAEVRSELFQLKASFQSMSLAGAAASNQVNLQVNQRQVETGTALLEAQQSSMPDDQSSVQDDAADDGARIDGNPVGAFAQAALQAGVLGLPHLLPDWVPDSKVVGYTIADDNRYEATYVPTDMHDHELSPITNQVNEHLEVTLLDVQPDQWLLATVAADDLGGRVGALVVLIHPPTGVLTLRKMRISLLRSSWRPARTLDS